MRYLRRCLGRWIDVRRGGVSSRFKQFSTPAHSTPIRLLPTSTTRSQCRRNFAKPTPLTTAPSSPPTVCRPTRPNQRLLLI